MEAFGEMTILPDISANLNALWFIKTYISVSNPSGYA